MTDTHDRHDRDRERRGLPARGPAPGSQANLRPAERRRCGLLARRAHRRGGARRGRPRPRAAAHALRRRLRRHLLPEGVRRPGPHARAPARAQRGARRLRVSRRGSRSRPSSPCAAVLLEFGTEEQKQRHIPADPEGRGDLDAVPLRAQRRLRRRRRADHRGARRRRVGRSTAPRSGPPARGGPTGACAWPAPTGTCPSTAASRVFILPIHQPGIEVHRIEMLNGSKEFCQEFLTDVRVPDSDRIGEVDDGWTVGTRWMFHEKNAMGGDSPYVTGARAATAATDGRRPAGRRSPRRPGDLDDPRTRDLVGEAHMLELGADGAVRAHRRRHAARACSRTTGAAIGRLFDRGRAPAQQHASRFELAGPSGRGLDRRRRRAAERGLRLPDAPDRRASAAAPPRWPATSSASGCSGMPRERTADQNMPFRDVPKGPPGN